MDGFPNLVQTMKKFCHDLSGLLPWALVVSITSGDVWCRGRCQLQCPGSVPLGIWTPTYPSLEVIRLVALNETVRVKALELFRTMYEVWCSQLSDVYWHIFDSYIRPMATVINHPVLRFRVEQLCSLTANPMCNRVLIYAPLNLSIYCDISFDIVT